MPLTNGGSFTTFGSALTENFDSLATSGTANTWTDNTTISGLYAQFSATPANPITYRASTGTDTTGAIYSFGVAGTNALTERAFGSVSSGTPVTIYYGFKLTNNTGSNIVALSISYNGEQWRDGGAAVPNAQSLNFQYQVAATGTITDANAPTTGWTSFSSLSFTSPTFTNTGSGVALDGNAGANRTAKSATLTFPTPVTNLQEIWIRWEDINDTGNDHGLAIDDISITAFGTSNLKFRSAASGNWNANATWEMSVDGTNWVAATSTPTSANDTINIRSGHTVTVTAGVTTDQTTVDSGGTLTVSSGITLSVNDGAGTDLQVAGTLNVTDTGLVNGAGSFTLASGATLGIGSANGITTAPTASGSIQTTTRSFDSGANYTYNGSAAQVTGNGLPTTVTGALTVTNTAGVTLSQSTTLNGASSIGLGATLNTGAFTLTVGNTITNSGTLNVSSSGTINGTGTVAGPVNVQSGGTVAPGTSPGILNTGNISFTTGSNFNVEFAGTTPGTGHDQLNVTGTVSLGDATLNTTAISFTPSAGDSFTIINNDSTDAVTGTFNGLSEGATVSGNFLGSGRAATISYMGGTGNDVVIYVAATSYVWTPNNILCPGPLNNDFNCAFNWNPVRGVTDPNDVLIFDGAVTPAPTVLNVPTQTIAALRLTNNINPVNFSAQTAPPGTKTLTMSGATGSDLSVPSGTVLNIQGTTGLVLSLTSASTGTVGGQIIFQGNAPHQLTATGGSNVTFTGVNGFTSDSTYSATTHPFGDGTGTNNNSIDFASGSTYTHGNGLSPFGVAANSVVDFQTGSTARYLTATGFDANGRNYSNLVIGDGSSAVLATDSGTGNFSFDNLTVNSTGSANSKLEFNGSGGSTITIRGDITSTGAGSGALPDVMLTGGTGGIVINKTVAGTVTFGNVGNTRPIQFESNATVASGTTLSLARLLYLGIIQPSSFVCTVNGGLTGSATGYLIGNEKRPFTGPESFTFHLGTPNGYSPLDANVTAGPGDLTVVALQGAQPILTSSTSLQRYWRITEGGTITSDLTFHYLQTDVAGNEANYRVIRVEGGTAVSFANDCPSGQACVDTVNNQATVTGMSAFSDWTLGEPNAPTLVKLTGFAAKQVGDEVTVQWRSGYEVRNLGFNLYREQDGKRVPITPSLIAGSALRVGPQTVMNAGLAYTWYDHLSANGKQSQVTYWLEDVDVDGTRTLHGPIAPSIEYSVTDKTRQSDTFDDLQRRAPASGPLFRSWPAAFTEEQAKTLSRPKPSERINLTQREIAGLAGVKIAITKSGWYRVTVAELLAAGFNPSGRVNQLQLYENARELPIKLSGDGTLANDSDYFEFYGHGSDSPTDAAQTYYLIVGKGAGKRINLISGGKPGTPSGPDSFDYTVERKDRLIYYAGLLNGDGENIFGGLVRRSLGSQTLPVRRLDTVAAGSGAQAKLEVSLVGVTKQAHNVLVSLNGQNVGTIDYSNNENPTKAFDVPASWLTEGDNTVQLTALNGNLDISLIETMRLTYPHLYAADNNVLAISVDSGKTRRITGFTQGQIRAVDISNPSSIAELKTAVTQNVDGTYSAEVQAPSAAKRNASTIIVFADSTVAHVDRLKSNQPSAWGSHVSGSDYVIITSNELKPGVEPLAALRRSQGLTVDVVDVEDLYDEFSYGQHSPSAIRDFLQTAVTSWQRKPRFVLLAGDSTLDPNNYLGQGQADVVPTKLLDTTLMETASDDWLADFDNDAIADLAIGRLPVSTTAAMNKVVTKIIAYENMPVDTSRGATLVADNTFESATDAVLPLLPSSMTATVINRSTADDATIHNQVIQSLNQGPTVANYFGHGSNEVWTGSGLLSSEDAPALTNHNRLTFYVMMTCFNGYFHDIFSESLGEALMKSQGGAISVWASSGMTEPDGQNEIDKALFRELFGGARPPLGDAVRAAKLTTNDRDVRLTWILFGDPATRLR